MTATLYPAERKILRLLLAEKFRETPAIISRLRTLRCTSRKMTGTGYYLNFDAQCDSSRIDHPDDELSEDFRTRLPPPQDIVGFTLFIRNGRLSWLEGYTFGDVRWPEEPLEEWVLLDEDEGRSERKPEPVIKSGSTRPVSVITDAERRKLEGQLREQLLQDCDECRRIGYSPSLFLSMMSKFGPVEASQHVIIGSKIPDGFIRLLELRRLDLTTEATVLRGPWQTLFSESVLEQARRRLIDYGWADLVTQHITKPK